MNRDEAVTVWALLGAAASGRELSEGDLELRAELIVDLDAAVARRVAVDLARTCRFVPSVGEFRDAVLAATEGPALTPADVIAELFDAVRRRGWIDPPGPGDLSPAAARALEAMGGWMTFCEGDEMVNRAHLVKLIPPLLGRPEAPRRPAVEAAPAPELDG